MYLDEYHFAKITFPSDYKKGQKIDKIAKAPITLTHTTTGRDRVHALELMCNNTILLVLIGFMSWQIVGCLVIVWHVTKLHPSTHLVQPRVTISQPASSKTTINLSSDETKH